MARLGIEISSPNARVFGSTYGPTIVIGLAPIKNRIWSHTKRAFKKLKNNKRGK